ncbi:MAG: phosphatase PAP2 family protein [Lachnospiraceae bacterium]|nr:phosphatase PAP2 family protein [Lachnospiraceae bacterium]
MKRNKKLIIAGISGLLFVVLIALVRLIDVQAIGPEGTQIGLSGLNWFVFKTLGVHMIWYEITDWLGIAAIFTAFLFALTGLIQWIRRKSLLKVDKEILALGGLYLIVIGSYVLFELVIVNYRPILMPGSVHPEASFPSSHTMLVCVIMGSAVPLLGKYVKSEVLCRALRIICATIIGITVVGRLISGVHWFTDILGGILISVTLLSLYAEILERIEKNNEQ